MPIMTNITAFIMNQDFDKKQPFRSIAETFIADENLFSDSSSPEEVMMASERIGKQFLKRIRNSEGLFNSRLEKSICFLDVLTIMPPGISRGFLITPNKQAEHTYHKAVEKLINNRMSIGDHPVFKAGLPLFVDSCFRPLTKKELKYYLSGLSGFQSIELSYIVKDIPETSGQSLNTHREDIATELTCYPVTYGQSIKTKDRFGDDDTSIFDNISQFIQILTEYSCDLYSLRKKPLKQVYAVPVTNWIKRRNGEMEYLSYGAFFMGLDETLNAQDEQHWIKLIRAIVTESIGTASRSQVDQLQGRSIEKTAFAHQTSAVIDSILNSINRLPENTKEEMGSLLLARLHLLRAVINSYRSKASRVDTGVFPYPWEKVTNPLAVYRDVGIQLGLARAQDAPKDEPNVRDAGYAGLWPENQPGQPGFEHHRSMFMPLPEVSSSTKKHLLHSNFAVLILLSMKQAFYHTLRARILGIESATISIRVAELDNEIMFECQVWNPMVKEDDRNKEAKDAVELYELAERLSDIPDHPVKYSVEGPNFDPAKDQWVTKTRILAKNLG